MYNCVDQEKFANQWQTLRKTHQKDRYIFEHKERYYELFDHLAHFTNGIGSPRVAEIGVSALTRMYKPLFPHIELVTIDRPTELFGVDSSFGIDECSATHHYGIDLNRESIHPQWGTPSVGQFDFVAFCEILEHLVINPVQICEELLSLLKPNGFLYLTTPNFFSKLNLERIHNRENPQAVMPRRGEDDDSGYHFREYALYELVDAIQRAGGKVVKAAYSDVWHDDLTKQLLQTTPHLRSNLLIVATPKNSEAPVEYIAENHAPSSSQLTKDIDDDYLQTELAHLRTLVNAYERGRFIRFMKWLKLKLPNTSRFDP